MDGYALKAKDTKGASMKHPILLDVVGMISAGQDEQYTIMPKKAEQLQLVQEFQMVLMQ